MAFGDLTGSGAGDQSLPRIRAAILRKARVSEPTLLDGLNDLLAAEDPGDGGTIALPAATAFVSSTPSRGPALTRAALRGAWARWRALSEIAS